MVLVVEMAQITPPVGFNLFVLQGMTPGRQLTWISRVTPAHVLLMCSRGPDLCLPGHRHLAAAADVGRLTRVRLR